jgi:murein biosynthesis integral membrane protein MurJ
MLTTKNTVRTVGFMIFATLAAKILGMVRDILLAGQYGTGMEAVAFLTASRIPLLFFDLGLGAAISSTFIPVFNQYLERGDKDAAVEFSNQFLNIIILVSSFITLIGIIFSRQWVNIIAAGLDEKTYALTVQLVQILFPMIIFTGIAYAFVGILQSFNEFNVPAAISLISNGIVIFYFLFLVKHFGIFGLALTMLFAWLAQVIVQIPFLIKKGYSYRPVISFTSEGIKRVSMLIIPILISTWVQPINAMVNIRLASYLNRGEAVAALDYANRTYIIVIGVFTYALGNVIFPSLSRMNAANNKEEFAKTLNTALRAVIYFIFPLMVGFIILRTAMVRFIYERGAFDSLSTQLTSTALLYYSLGMVGFGIQEIMNKAFYALHDASTPMKIGVAGITLNIVLSFILVQYMGIGGLALAASIAAITISITLAAFINKRVGGIINSLVFYDLGKIAAASLIMGVIAAATHRFAGSILGDNTLLKQILNLSLTGLVGMLVYAVLTLILGVKEAKIALDIIRDRFKRV